MKVTALLFASLRSTAGQDRLVLELPPGATVRRAATALESRFQGLALQGSLCAVNEDYSHPDTPLQEGDTIAFLPPVSGG